MVATAGSPSGMAAIASAMLVSIIEQPDSVYASLLPHLAKSVEDPETGALLAEAMGSVGDPRFISALMELLPRRQLREAARLALLEHGDDALEALDACLGDPDCPPNIRRHVPRTIHRFAPEKAAPILMAHLLEIDDGLIRYKIIRALLGLRSREPALPLDHALLNRGVEGTLAGALRVIDWRRQLEIAAASDPQLPA